MRGQPLRGPLNRAIFNDDVIAARAERYIHFWHGEMAFIMRSTVAS
jgi:hypothetical protein